MAPIRKEVYDKNAWAWAENASLDGDIPAENIAKVYRLDIQKCKFGSCKRNCRGNPFCLTGLGEARWLSDNNDALDDIGDPEENKRPENNFVGLKNLGATCYVNSLLQLWFHNIPFREAIFSWNPLEDPQEKENLTLIIDDNEISYTPVSVVGHLQVLFAMMALSSKRTVDPTDFVASLGLDTSEQQDAQEFSKLFFSLLENKLRDQGNPLVSNFIQINFCGEYSYVTRCSFCQTESARSSQFYELDLNILGLKTLKESLADFLKEEKLEGANKYFCGVCDSKQDATRFIKLTHLPPVLCIQLMRFVFDRQKGNKKKLNSHLLFPETVDMTEYIEGASRPFVYNLSAVLVHKGPGAHSGHYVAHIATSKGWYKFNDENVQNMDGKKLEFGEDELEEFSKKSKTPRTPKGSVASSDAYMLVYSLVNEKSDGSSKDENLENLQNVQHNLHPKVLKLVLSKNAEFQKWIEEVTVSRNTKLGNSMLLKAHVSSIVKSLPVKEEPSFDLISSSWLCSWLADDGTKEVEPIDNSELLCIHKKINPNAVTDGKYVTSDAADKLYEQFYGGPRLKLPEDQCLDCILNQLSLIKLRAKTGEEYKFISLVTRNKLEENIPGFWVSKKSLKSWRRLVLDSVERQLNSTSGNYLKLKKLILNPSKCVGLKESSSHVDSNSLISNSNLNSKGTDEKPGHASDLLVTADENPFKKINGSSMNDTASENLPSSYPESSCSSFQNDRVPFLHSEKLLIGEVSDNCSDAKKYNEIVSSSSECETLNRIQGHSDDNRQLYKNSPTSSLTGVNGLCFSPRSMQKVTEVKKCYVLLESIDEAVRNVKKSLFNIIDDKTEVVVKKTRLNESMGNIVEEVKVIKDSCKSIIGNICNRDLHRKAVAKKLEKEGDVTSSVFKENKESSQVCSSNCTESSDIAGNSDECTSPILGKRRSQKREILHEQQNGVAKKLKLNDDDVEAGQGGRLEDFEGFNGDIICEHGELCLQENLRRLVPSSVWDIFKSYFPSAKTFTEKDEPCNMCLSLACEDEVAKDQLKQEATKQKDQLNDLFQRLCSYQSRFNVPIESSPVYLVCMDFISEWKKFIRDASKNERPMTMDNRGLLCSHNLLKYNPELDVGTSKFVVVSEEEWQILKESYHTKCEISARRDPETRLIKSEPDICEKCLVERLEEEQQKQLTYSRAKIFIRFIQDDTDTGSDDASHSSKKLVKANPNGTVSSTVNNVNGPSSIHETQEVRRSTRPRRGRGEKEITVSSSETLKDIKVKIYQMIGVAPFDQQLSLLDGPKLEENTATLSSMGIYPSSVLLLRSTENTGDLSRSDFTTSELPEAGFKGTELMRS